MQNPLATTSVRLKAIVVIGNGLGQTKAEPAGSGRRRRHGVLGRLGRPGSTMASVASLDGARNDA